MTFPADSSRVDAVLPQPNHSGYVGKPCAFGLHDIECPPGDQYQSLAGPDYLQNPAEQHSVQYVRIGKWRAQGVQESYWAWGMGTPASKHTTHEEQAGYASFTRAQWLGLPEAVGSSYTKAGDGSTATYTADDAQFMADQFDGIAGDYADWCQRNGYTPHLGTMDELARTCNGEELGILFTHAMASQLPNTTTVHTDPGPNYPLTELIALASAKFSGVTSPTTPVTPTTPATPTPPTEDEQIMAAADDILAAIQGDRNNTQAELRAEVRAATGRIMTDNRAQTKALGAALVAAITAGGTPTTIAAAVDKSLTDNFAAVDAALAKDAS
jgi:hypothetical protein